MTSPNTATALLVLALAFGQPGCRRSTSVAPAETGEASPPPARSSEALRYDSEPPAPLLPPVARPVPPVVETPAALEARYFRGQLPDEECREIIQSLGSLGTPAAADALTRIFQREKRLETRLEALQVLMDFADDVSREQKFTTLQKAISPAMAQTIRLSALQSMADFEDPRARGALKALAHDRDSTVRQAAAILLDDLKP